MQVFSLGENPQQTSRRPSFTGPSGKCTRTCVRAGLLCLGVTPSDVSVAELSPSVADSPWEASGALTPALWASGDLQVSNKGSQGSAAGHLASGCLLPSKLK